MKKFLKILKKIFITILIVFIALMAFGAILTKCGKVDARDYTAAAATEEPEVEEDIISSDMAAAPSATYYKETFDLKEGVALPFVFNKTYNDLYLNSGYYFECQVTNIPSTTFTFFASVNNGCEILLQWNSWAQRLEGNKVFKVFDGGSNNAELIQFLIRPGSGVTPTDFTLNCYIVNGSLDESFLQGYVQGIEQGYQNGITEGTNEARYGIFNGATVDAYIEYAQGQKITVNGLIPNYINSGLNFDNIYAQYINYNGDPDNNAELVDLTIYLKIPWQWSYQSVFQLTSSATTDVMDLILVDSAGKQYTFEFFYADNAVGNYDWVSKYPLDSNAPIYSASSITQIKLGFGRATDTLDNCYITLKDGGYYTGYNAGYNSGFDKGNTEGYQNGAAAGYDKGITEGKAEGYAQAIAEGVSQEGIFNGAIAFIRTFFQLTTQLLNTKIVGDINFGLIIIGLPAVGMLANLVMGFVKKHIGGRGADD